MLKIILEISLRKTPNSVSRLMCVRRLASSVPTTSQEKVAEVEKVKDPDMLEVVNCFAAFVDLTI